MENSKILAACVCPQIITDDTYWSSAQPTNLCLQRLGITMATILAGIHGPPTITPIPGGASCSETVTCDPACYNKVLEISRPPVGFLCYSSAITILNSVGPFTCRPSGFFRSPTVFNPVRAFLCYFDPAAG